MTIQKAQQALRIRPTNSNMNMHCIVVPGKDMQHERVDEFNIGTGMVYNDYTEHKPRGRRWIKRVKEQEELESEGGEEQRKQRATQIEESWKQTQLT